MVDFETVKSTLSRTLCNVTPGRNHHLTSSDVQLEQFDEINTAVTETNQTRIPENTENFTLSLKSYVGVLRHRREYDVGIVGRDHRLM